MSRRALAKLARQCLGPVALLLQRLSQLRRRALGRLRLSCAASSAALLASASCVSMSRRALAKFASQCLGPVVLLLQRLSQLRCRALGRLVSAVAAPLPRLAH